MIRKSTREWMNRMNIVSLKLFSEKADGDLEKGWNGFVEDGDFDFVIYETAWGRGIYIESQWPDLPLAAIGVDEFSTKMEFREILKGADYILGYGLQKVDLPMIEKSLDVELDAVVVDLLEIGLDMTAQFYSDAGFRIPLVDIAKRNEGNYYPFYQHLNTAVERIRDWKKGGFRAVLRSVKKDAEMITNSCHYIYTTRRFKFGDKETGKNVFVETQSPFR